MGKSISDAVPKKNICEEVTDAPMFAVIIRGTTLKMKIMLHNSILMTKSRKATFHTMHQDLNVLP